LDQETEERPTDEQTDMTDSVTFHADVVGNYDKFLASRKRAVRQCHMSARHGTGSHFVTQRPSDPGIQRPGDLVDPVTLFYNELQMSRRSILRPKNF